MGFKHQAAAILVSLALNAGLLAVLSWIILEHPTQQVFALETILDPEERSVEDIVQPLDDEQEPATDLNLFHGGNPSDIGGSETPLVPRQPIKSEDLIREPELQVQPGSETLPGQDELDKEFENDAIEGEGQAIVEGYGDALDRLTWELIRLMWTDKLLVVWLFDESGSMQDDREDIKRRLFRVYQELRIIEDEARLADGERPKLLADVLTTAVHSFGQTIHEQTREPTSDYGEVMAAIDRTPVDPSGDENLCGALRTVLHEYKGRARHERRKLVVIVVSDESGDDGDAVEEVIQVARSSRAPIYILGREAVFGSLYAHVRWQQPETGRVFHLPIRRGPETPYAEQLQFDGYRARRDSQMSGFGPYEQVRLCLKTGGIFFQLPHETANLNDLDDRRNEALDLKEYLPSADSRRDYVLARGNSEFRQAIWDVIVLLNPYQENNQWLNLPDPEFEREVFTTDPAEYMPRVLARIGQMDRILRALQEAEEYLESVRPLRAGEPFPRWRANYDLIRAQIPWYRVRMFEYAIALHQFAVAGVPAAIAKQPQHNRWYIREAPSEWVLPTPEQEKLLNVTAADLQQAHADAVGRLQDVQQQHSGTPWSRRAEWELGRKFGVTFSTYHQGPPQPNNRPQPTPTPPPKL